ncbi:Phospholipid-glycerol acyltransferase [Babesia duncani]|uniref:Phospholipid-glycerol acyltransferase n=1 Tax=Babesia duncani TaxID=323732 RepID=A0AAD9UPL3_9APIC|nr:Phospholipid-glycerol acyltransferase [Babesia duncani]
MVNITATEFRTFNAYLMIKWLVNVIVHSLFTKITIINEEALPLYGPLILVSNHNNQFIDAVAMIYSIPRQISFLVAMKTVRRKLVGTLAKLIGCIPVHRGEDLKYDGLGKVFWKLGSNVVNGVNSRFLIDMAVGDKLTVNNETHVIKEVVSENEVIIETPISFECKDMERGEPFKIIPKVQLSETYDAVSVALRYGNSICIFPEGGSHDRTNLLPLKPGVALMALNALADGSDDIVIVPVGLAYTDGYALQSTATMYIGKCITITKADCEESQNDRRRVVTRILEQIEKGLKQCMITASTKSIIGWIDLCGSLYPPERTVMSPNKAFELRKIIAGIFSRYEDSPETRELCEHLARYKTRLESNYLHDDEVWLLKQSLHSATLMLVEQSIKLICCVIMGLSFAPLWLPLHGISKFFAERHRRHALKNSVVKLEGSDVVASYKVLVLIAIVPLFNLGYGLILGLYLYREPEKVAIVVLITLCVLPLLYYVNLKNVRKIPKLLRQLRIVPLIFMGRINVWRETERELITMRTELQLKVREYVHNMGPKTSETFNDELRTLIPKVRTCVIIISR